MNELHRSHIVVITIAATIAAYDAGGQRRVRTDEPRPAIFQVTSTNADALHDNLSKVIRELEYPDEVADSFIRMVSAWKDDRGRPVLVALSQTLARSRKARVEGQISEDELSRIEESMIVKLGQCIRTQIAYRRNYFDLADVTGGEKANCFGYSQIFYVLGNSIGLSARAMRVTPGHIANIVGLSDETMTVVDLTRADGFISERIITESGFEGDGSHWKLEGKGNLVREDKMIHILDHNELVGEIYFCRGTVHYLASQGSTAIPHYDRAIELNPTSAKAYNNRGGAYLVLGEHAKAISDFNKALELDPEYTSAYHNRANAHLDSDRYTEAIIDYTNTIERDGRFAKAFFGRGFAYLALEDYARAVSDYTRAIEADPTFARAYYTRAIGHAHLGEDEKAKRDMRRAVELDRTLEEDVRRISSEYELDIRFENKLE